MNHCFVSAFGEKFAFFCTNTSSKKTNWQMKLTSNVSCGAWRTRAYSMGKHFSLVWRRRNQLLAGYYYGPITWRISARAEILLRLHDGLQPGLKLLSSAPSMKLRAKSLRRIKMAPRTRIVKIGALLLSQFGLLAALKFQLFWMVTAYRWWNWGETWLWLHISRLEIRICKEREDIFKLAEFRAFSTASYCSTLSAVKSMFSYSIWALKLERQRIRFSLL